MKRLEVDHGFYSYLGSRWSLFANLYGERARWLHRGTFITPLRWPIIPVETE